jgi:hypothetical protein
LAWFVAFLVLDGGLAQLTGWRFLLFPPLVVIGFEMFAHPVACPWAGRPLMLPVACTLSALTGLLVVQTLGAGPLAAIGSIAVAVLVLGVLDLHVPPALAVGLLPMVIAQPDHRFPVAVALGALMLTTSFLFWRRICALRLAASSAAPD